ncbi:MAG: hypothetical protein ACYTF1_19850 [Planctomycetota bacterium]|jgi:hypothetical protein
MTCQTIKAGDPRPGGIHLPYKTDFVATHGPDTILAIAKSGTVFAIDNQGRLIGNQTLNSAVTAFLRPGEHRNTKSILLGTGDGHLMVLTDK